MSGSNVIFFFSSRRRHTRYWRDWSSDVCSSDLSTPASFGPFFLRMMVAAIFFYQGAQKTFGWFGGQGWHGTVSALTEAGTMSHFMIILAMLTELLISFLLFFGLLTRVAGIGIICVMIGTLVYMNEGSS